MIPVIYHRHADKTEYNRAKMVGEVSSVVITIDHRKHTVRRKRIANPVRAHLLIGPSLWGWSVELIMLCTKRWLTCGINTV